MSATLVKEGATAIALRGRRIGPGEPCYIIAEMSANHGQDLAKAKEIVHAMKESGADAMKMQTYTPETITLDCRNEYFVDCLRGTLWEGRSLYELYAEAFTPWEWQAELKELAESLEMDCFSTAFDASSVEFLESIDVPAYKVASFELVHLPLIRRIAQTQKPMILSTGMASREEIAEAVAVAHEAGATDIALLKCTSAYPAKIEDANLRTIPALAAEFGVPVGLSDHTLGSTVPVAAMTQGACLIEKHFVLDREKDKGPDSAFSMEPQEFRSMVDTVRSFEENPDAVHADEKALGEARFGASMKEMGSVVFRPSLFVVEDMSEGEEFTEKNMRIIRPGYGLPPKHFDGMPGKRAARSIACGTPLSWDLIE